MVIILSLEGEGWLSYNFLVVHSDIKTSGSELQGQEEAAWVRIFRPMQPLQWVIYMDGSSKILYSCNSTTIKAIM